MSRSTRALVVSLIAAIAASIVALSVVSLFGLFQNNWGHWNLMAMNVAMFWIPALTAQVFGRNSIVFGLFGMLYASYSVVLRKPVSISDVPLGSLAFVAVGIIVSYHIVRHFGTTPRQGGRQIA